MGGGKTIWVGIVDLFGGFLGKGLIFVFVGFNILFVWVWDSFIFNVVQGFSLFFLRKFCFVFGRSNSDSDLLRQASLCGSPFASQLFVSRRNYYSVYYFSGIGFKEIKMRKIGFVLIWVVLLGCGVVVGIESNSLPVSTEVEYNSVDVSAVVEAETVKNIQVVTEGESKITGESKNIDIHEHAIKAYQQSVTSLQWAIGIILGLVSAFLLLLLFKNKQEYKEALREVREALKDAREASRDAVGCAEKMRDKLESVGEAFASKIKEIDVRVEVTFAKKIKEIDSMAKEELDKIRERGEKVKRQIDKKAEQEREISKLWSEGLRAFESKDYIEAAAKFETIIEKYGYENANVYINWGLAFGYDSDKKGGDEKLLEEAISKFQKAIEINSDYYLAHQCYGWVLSKMSDFKGEDEGLLEEAISEYKKSIGINPDYYETHCGYGYVLGKLSDLKDGDEKMLEEAISEYKKAIKIKPGSYEAHNGYGYVLVQMSDLNGGDEKFLKEAISEFKEANNINSKDHDVYNNWGWALLGLSTLKEGGEERTLLAEAEEKLLMAEKIKRGSGAYNLACVRCRLDDADGCKEWLKVAEEEVVVLPSREHAMKDDDLEKVRDEGWFKGLKWKGEK